MVSAIKCIEALDTDHGRAKDLVLLGCSHKSASVRLACVKILPRLMGDEDTTTFSTNYRKWVKKK